MEDQQKQQPPAPQVQGAPRVFPKRKPSSKSGMAGPKKLLIFDADLMEMVKRGDNSADKLLLLTGVDPLQFSGRIEFLCSKGYLCRDASNPNIFRLGLKGYDELAKKRVALERKAKRLQKEMPEETVRVPGETVQEKAALGGLVLEKITPAVAIERKPEKQDPPPAPQYGPPAPQSQGGSDIDLFELLKKGSPKNGSYKPAMRRDFSERVVAPKPSFEQQVQQLGGKEAVREMIEKATQSGACELCRSPFKLSVRPEENNPKYGYCFCGAAYHKDCYESLSHSDEAACVRCGKKLRIQMDRSSEDAFKAIKKLFD